MLNLLFWSIWLSFSPLEKGKKWVFRELLNEKKDSHVWISILVPSLFHQSFYIIFKKNEGEKWFLASICSAYQMQWILSKSLQLKNTVKNMAFTKWNQGNWRRQTFLTANICGLRTSSNNRAHSYDGSRHSAQQPPPGSSHRLPLPLSAQRRTRNQPLGIDPYPDAKGGEQYEGMRRYLAGGFDGGVEAGKGRRCQKRCRRWACRRLTSPIPWRRHPPEQGYRSHLPLILVRP